MTPVKNALVFAVIILVAGFSGYAMQRYLAVQETEHYNQTNPVLGQLRQEFAMSDLDGQMRNIKEWDGQVVLVNFWATWCPPCLREIPLFVELQEKYGDQGFQILGIAIDDEESVRAFAAEHNINYPIMAGELEAIELSQRYGNPIGGLPYSVVINRKGEISDTIIGDLDKIKAEEILKKLGLKV